VNVYWYLTCSRICSATRSVLKILPTKGVKFLCHCISFFLSISTPSSISMAEIFAAFKHVEVMDSIPETLRYSSTLCKDTSVPYSSATSLKPLWFYYNHIPHRKYSKFYQNKNNHANVIWIRKAPSIFMKTEPIFIYLLFTFSNKFYSMIKNNI